MTFFTDIRNARRKTIDLIFKVLKPEVKNAFISVIEWLRIPAWYLKDRMLVLSDGTIVQRDLYSAYLHQHADASLEHPDREACIRDFSAFMSMHDALIRQMKADGTSMKQCFGF